MAQSIDKRLARLEAEVTERFHLEGDWVHLVGDLPWGDEEPIHVDAYFRRSDWEGVMLPVLACYSSAGGENERLTETT